MPSSSARPFSFRPATWSSREEEARLFVALRAARSEAARALLASAAGRQALGELAQAIRTGVTSLARVASPLDTGADAGSHRATSVAETLERAAASAPPADADAERLLRVRLTSSALRGLIARAKGTAAGAAESLAVAEAARALSRYEVGISAIVSGCRAAVAAHARPHVRVGLPLEDLVQEGCIGLLRAVERFDVDVGVRFMTYAQHWVSEAIEKASRGVAGPLHVPLQMSAAAARAFAARRALEARLGREVTDEEVSTASRLELERVRAAEAVPRLAVSLHRAFGPEQDEAVEGDLAQVDALSVADLVAEGEVVALLRARLAALPAVERFVVTHRFGMDGGEEETLATVGLLLGVCRERVRRIELRALGRLAGALAPLREAPPDPSAGPCPVSERVPLRPGPLPAGRRSTATAARGAAPTGDRPARRRGASSAAGARRR